MRILKHKAVAFVLAHPLDFALQCLKGFRANQGLLLAGAVAYYSLLSIVPLLMLVVVALSHIIPQQELLQIIGRYLEWLIPGQSQAVVAEVGHFLDHRELVGWALVLVMLFFSSLASRCWKTPCVSSSCTAPRCAGAITWCRPSCPIAISCSSALGRW